MVSFRVAREEIKETPSYSVGGLNRKGMTKVSFKGKKKIESRPDWSPLEVLLIQIFRRASPTPSYKSPPGVPR